MAAQLHAAFSASFSGGCSPVVVQFTDQSTGAPVSWSWDLGNGNRSALQNPSAVYFTPGTYSVKLVVRNASGQADSVTQNQLITVYPSPVPLFGAQATSGCEPFTLSLVDNSTVQGGSVVQWQWDFGDGYGASVPSPQHTYNTTGTFNVTLQVISNQGCVSTVTRSNYVQVSAPPAAAFGGRPLFSCQPPDTVTFFDSSAASPSVAYLWNFGDGGTSTLPSPIHIYTQTGSYNVTLTAQGAPGCASMVSKPALVNIGGGVASFTPSVPSACSGTAVSFVNTSTLHGDSLRWNFGDGTVSNLPSPSHIYASPGTYMVTLRIYAGSCGASDSLPVVVNARPAGTISANLTKGCAIPLNVNFSTTATGTGLTYFWDFGDGQTSVLQNPDHTYNQFDSFSVKLVLAAPGGCSDTIFSPKLVNLFPPAIQWANQSFSGCVPYTFRPQVTVTGNDSVASYAWNWGDGTTATGPAPAHTYTNQGIYNISLMVTTVSGCTATSTDTPVVRTGTRPAAAFSATPTTVCAGQAVYFTNLTTGPQSSWTWYFGGTGPANSTLENPVFGYTDTGTFNVALLVRNNGCADSVFKPLYITVKPPVSIFGVNPFCSQRMTRSFVDRSIEPKTWLWNFGDGTTSTTENPTHTYTTVGNDTVTLTVTNGACTNTSVGVMYIRMLDPAFTASVASACKGSPVLFNLDHLDTTITTQVLWNFGDGTTQLTGNARTVQHAYATRGRYKVQVTVTDGNGCDTSYVSQTPISVMAPTAAFTTSSTVVCAGVPVTFTDHSISDGVYPIVSRTWDFGDGPPDSLLSAPIQHTYTSGGSMPVVLAVRDSSGCTDTTLGNIIVSDPAAFFTVLDTAICLGAPLTFVNGTTGGVAPVTYTWNFGDGTVASSGNPAYSPAHAFAKSGMDTVTLSVKDAIGCTSTYARANNISVQTPAASFKVSQKVTLCPPLLEHFTNTSSGFSIVHWDFGDGNTSADSSPVHFYTYPGHYAVTLTVTGTGSCTTSYTDTIIVFGPTGTMTYAPDSGCNNLTSRFSVTSDSAIAFVWDFGDGQTLSTRQNAAVHTYADSGTYHPRVILVSASQCEDSVTGPVPIHIYQALAGVSLNLSNGCGNVQIQFTDSSASNDSLGAYYWNFGDGTSATSANARHAYTAPGTYSLIHAVTTRNGCTDTLRYRDTIHIYPVPSVSIAGDTSACAPASLAFTAAVTGAPPGPVSWSWNLGNGQTASMATPPSATYTNPGTYNVVVIVSDAQGCTDTTRQAVTIYSIPVTTAGGSYRMCKGSTLRLQAGGATRYVWAGSPYLGCDTCAAPSVDPPSSMMFYVTGYTAIGCAKRDSAFVEVIKPDTVRTGRDTGICAGGSAPLSAAGAGLYTWSPASGLSNPGISNPFAGPGSTTTYTVTGTDSAHCFSSQAQVTVTVNPLPAVKTGPDLTTSVGSPASLQVTSSADVTSWVWSPPTGLSCDTCPNPQASPANTTQYTVTARNAFGCTAQDTVTVFVTCANGTVFIPNTFSPNGDGVNDIFYPRGKGIAMVKSLRVFNRWGQLVFERENFPANDQSMGWDGTVGGRKLSPDVFAYYCEIICENNQVLLLKGDVTLLR